MALFLPAACFAVAAERDSRDANGPNISLHVLPAQIKLGGFDPRLEGLPRGLTVKNAQIAAGAETARILLAANAEAAAGSTQGYVTFVDTHNRNQSMLFLAEKRNMLRTLPPVVKLKAVDRELHARPGAAVGCRFHVQRTSNFRGPMQLTLLKASNAAGFLVDPIDIAEGETEAVATIHVSKSSEPTTALLMFRATGELYDNREVVSETEVTVHVHRS